MNKPIENSNSLNVPNVLRQASRDLFRGRAFVAVAAIVLTLCLTATGSFMLLLFNINRNMKGLSAANEMVVYINEETPPSENLRSSLLSVSGVNGAKLVTKAEALTAERERFSEYPNLFEYATEDTYRDSYVLTIDKNADTEKIRSEIKNIFGVAKVVANAEIVEKVRGFERGISLVFTGFGVGLLVISVFVIFSAVKQAYYARREEISIMRYVGATRSFICAPFIVEGGIIGLVSGLAAALISGILYAATGKIIKNVTFDFFTAAPAAKVIPVTIVLLAVCGTLLGTLASYLSVKRYARG